MSIDSASLLIPIKTTDGITLEADLYPGPRPYCILAHGKAYDKTAWKDLATEMQDWGWTSLALNFRGYGQSERGDGTAYEQDILAGLAFARSQEAKPLVLFGASMGGAAILSALTKDPGFVDAIILLSPAGGSEHLSTLTGHVGRGLLLYSQDDTFAGMAQDVANHAPFPLCVRQWPGDLHAHKLLNSSQRGPEVKTSIREFLRYHLSH
ncbi:MAG: alpha/beta fold hydrolase [Acidithiobacillus sp.]